MAGAHDDGVDRVTYCPGQVISLKKAVAFDVADDRFVGAAASQPAFDGWRPFARALRDMNVGGGQRVAAIASVDIRARDGDAGDAFDLGDLILQHMAVIGKGGNGANADDELAAVRARW